MPGIADLSGRTVNTLRVGAMTSRYPAPKYAVVCSRCGARTTESQAKLTSGAARCVSAGCGRDGIREAIADTPAKARQREADAEAAKRREKEEAEVAKLARAEATLAETASKVARTIRERISTQPDDEVFVTPELRDAKMSRDEAVKFDGEQFRVFASRNSWFHDTPGNRRTVLEYFQRNRLEIIDAQMFEAAAKRLAEFSLLPDERPAPVLAKPETTTVNLSVERTEPQPQSRPETKIGIDPLTGREREYTRWEVGRMTADDFAKAFGLRRVDYAGSPVRSIR